MDAEKIRLTQTVQKGGCAAKVAASELRKILSRVEFPPQPKELIVDASGFDDAAVFEISNDLALVKTIDFFTPIVDSPRIFGEIAAVNALSDVYAMGGRPVLALAVLAFPLATLPPEIAQEVLQGACNALRRAGASLGGGHSIDDDTLKFGLSVTGFVHPKKVWKNSGAQVGDHLILTKGLGTGTLTAGLKRGAFSESDISGALQSMCTLNNIIDFLGSAEKKSPINAPQSSGATLPVEIERLISDSIHAATDITGFGLSGHSLQMARASNKQLQIDLQSLPLLPGARQAIQNQFLTKAHRTNLEYTKNEIRVGADDTVLAQLIHDPQTSGGLLLSVAPDQSQNLLRRLQSDFPATRIVGAVLAREKSSDAYVVFR